MSYLHCKTCLCSQTGDKLGEPCRTHGCDGVIEQAPDFKDLVDELPEPMTCGRRAETGMDDENGPFAHAGKNLDRWQKFKNIDNRVCSYCGSLHPDDMFRLVHESAMAPEDASYTGTVEIEPSDKPYKTYIHQPGVRNASEGGIKWYMQHLPRGTDGKIVVTDEQQEDYSLAVKKSAARFAKCLAERFPKQA